VLERLEKNLALLPPVSSLVDEGKKPEELVNLVCQGLPYKIVGDMPLYFSCNCSRERLKNILLSLGTEELEQMISEQGQAEVQCHFCAEKYKFNSTELQQILHQATENN